eukprot:TRINITY_DN1889_c0_g1_i1.p1 TRINITY_DN1889_c0_g1~~TRINITY_DN1889_c0_g1_i1.p1  ORF type:complete len:162 (+),score=21.69 TRINITY_DN1889_c0_g1_i1:60-545(+)
MGSTDHITVLSHFPFQMHVKTKPKYVWDAGNVVDLCYLQRWVDNALYEHIPNETYPLTYMAVLGSTLDVLTDQVIAHPSELVVGLCIRDRKLIRDAVVTFSFSIFDAASGECYASGTKTGIWTELVDNRFKPCSMPPALRAFTRRVHDEYMALSTATTSRL